MTIMIDGCQNCHQSKMHHMPDGACLFEPTTYKAFPLTYITYPMITVSSDLPHVQAVFSDTWWTRFKKFWLSLFR
jgi:hypothetical protein